MTYGKQLSENFNSSEFDSPDEKNSGLKMSPTLINKLQTLRDLCGFPLIINSGYRTVIQNARVNGAVDSAHLHGLAADIKLDTDFKRFRCLYHAMNVGFNRIGIGKNFIHLDIDIRKTKDIIWLY